MSVTAPGGFVAAGGACGIKANGRPDLSLVATADGGAVAAAATFTANRLKAAPVLVTAAHLAATGGHAAAVILNSGNANAATGASGRQHAERMCAATAAALGCAPEEVLVCSTGLIGIPLPIDAAEAGIAPLVASRSADGGRDAAVAIMTTDTVAKEALFAGRRFSVGGMAKGAAMLAPNMATMLAVLTTDAAADPATLKRLLQAGVAESFNLMSVDGCTSTNDTVIILASGVAGPVPEEELGPAIAAACFSLATQMVGDAEGATKVVRVEVVGAASDDEAARGARKVAESQLVKCSWYGEDPYWGRIGSELGSAGIDFDTDRLAVAYGGVVVAAEGIAVDHDEAALKQHMGGRFLTVRADLGLGSGSAFVLTNDLSHAYVDENMGTS
ncbi:MAG: glutamate N-acetyltransferase / amino-acid N-acetyltransferase [Acidimicrobiaceae bacterium]|nr:glutamate N-acetyltransferase / amino-acid N-acetyltransferase [Acidimicrobiaceae bacterium]